MSAQNKIGEQRNRIAKRNKACKINATQWPTYVTTHNAAETNLT